MDPQKTELGRSQAQDPVRTERRLARGLEDVSDLFLSRAADESAAGVEPRASPSGPSPVKPSNPSPAFVLHPLSAVDRDQLLSVLNNNIAVLEEGLQTIDANIPCDYGGPIDLIAVDRSSQLAVIDLAASANDELLLRGICHCDWLTRNISIVRRMYRGLAINFSSQPRLFLVAPDYSPLFRCAAHRISCPQISCFRYRAAAIPSGAGILFERS